MAGWSDYVEAGTGDGGYDDEWLRRKLAELDANPVGTETQQTVSQGPTGRTWGDTARDIIPNIQRGAGAVGDLLKADVFTSTADFLGHPGVSLREGDQWITTDAGPMVKRGDKWLHPSELDRRAAFLPIETQPGWHGATSLALPGMLDLIPAAGAGGAAPEGALAANAFRRARAGPRAAGRLAPPVKEFEAGAAPYISEAEAALSRAPEAPLWKPGEGAPMPPRLEPGLLWDPEQGNIAARGATQGMTPEAYEAWKAERRGLMDEGIASMNKIGKGERGNASLPDLRQMTAEEAAKVAKGDPHLAFKRPDGNYVGAPAGTETRRDLLRLRKDFDAQVARGEGGSDWYTRVQSYIDEVSGGDPIKARQIAEEWAVMSAQADPGTNTAFSLQARNRRMLDKNTDAGVIRTGQQAETYKNARDVQDEWLLRQDRRNSIPGSDEALDPKMFPAMKLGKKTDIYRQHMDPTAREGSTGTNDIWHGRAFGFKDPVTGAEWDKAFGEASHNWLDYETMQALNRANKAKLGGRNDWKPGEIQAAPWVSGKSESLQKRFKVSPEEGDRRANATYPDYAHWYTGSMPHEQVPGGNSGLSTGTMTPEEWQAAARRVNPAGLDPMLEHMGAVQRRTEPAYGAWEDPATKRIEVNPADVTRPQIDTKTVDKKRIFNPDTANAFESAAAVRGATDMQIGNPFTVLDPRAPPGKRTSVTMNLGRGMTADEAKRLEALGSEHKLNLTNTGDGAAFLNFNDHKGGDVQKLLDSKLALQIRAIIPDAKIGRAHFDLGASRYVDYEGRQSVANAGKGETIRHMDQILQKNREGGPSAYQSLLDNPNEARKAQQNLERLDASGQIGVRPDYELWLRLVAERGIKGALEWARSNNYRGLPAAVGGAGLGAGLLGAGNSSDRGS